MSIKIAIWKFLHPKSYLCIKTIPNGSKKFRIILKKISFSTKGKILKFFISFKCICVSVEMTEHEIELCSF